MPSKTVWFSLSDLNDLQIDIMDIIDTWAYSHKKPISLKLIMSRMKRKKIIPATTIKSIEVLLKKGYIRRANTISNKTFFVQLRRV